MLAKRFYDYIGFGVRFAYLLHGCQGWKNGRASKAITRFLENLEEFRLPVTLRAGERLEDFGIRLAAKPANEPLVTSDVDELKRLMGELNATLSAEAKGNPLYLVTDKRLDTVKLLTNVSALMRPGVFTDLPEVARCDLEEAGKCIAFERPTAAAFHLLRGTEAVLRSYYSRVVKRNRVDPLLWGPMIESLRKRKRAPAAELLDNLNNIRRSFRNPTLHPEKRYDIDEAQDLFGLCIDVINRMHPSAAAA